MKHPPKLHGGHSFTTLPPHNPQPQTRVSDDGYEPLRFLIPPAAMEAACRADRGSIVVFTSFGGRLVATDGKRLACCPATVPSREFILPVTACHILGHPDFTADLATITRIDPKEPEQHRVAIRSRKHLLISKTLVGSYPNYRQVIPASANQMAVIPHDRKPGLIAWLRSLGKDQCSVRLDWHKRSQLTLSHRDANGHSATLQVPVEIHGSPPVIAFNARYLADARGNRFDALPGRRTEPGHLPPSRRTLLRHHADAGGDSGCE